MAALLLVPEAAAAENGVGVAIDVLANDDDVDSDDDGDGLIDCDDRADPLQSYIEHVVRIRIGYSF